MLYVLVMLVWLGGQDYTDTPIQYFPSLDNCNITKTQRAMNEPSHSVEFFCLDSKYYPRKKP